MKSEDIDQEVTEKLEAVVHTASRAHPRES